MENGTVMIERALFLSPHTDDVELGCGATIAMLSERGVKLHVMALSTGNPVTGASQKEFIDAMDALCVASRSLAHFETQKYERDRQLILDLMIGFRKEFEPQVVFCPSGYSLHQDHITVYNEARRAFRHSSLVYYESPFVTADFRPELYIPVEQRHLDAKLFALDQYDSQRGKIYFDHEFIDGLAHVRGLGVETGLAEAYEVERWIL